ncbi:gp301 [Sphingomonas phage PAU]|uniref:gp301 n=1 Tax=Sphingomonas phage PAU TaxID=1150991 RepID=UPI00025734AC|nr:gp301 [Sphingomonas phage PAU]AFF28298.1 gp301 [Sphingomonas phage PAU]
MKTEFQEAVKQELENLLNDKETLKSILQDRLTIETEKETSYGFHSDSNHVTVKLRLDGEVISSDSFLIRT